MDSRYDILELTRFLAELSVIDYYFVGQRPSTVALAALLNAMEAIPSVSESAIDDLANELRRVPSLDPAQEDVEENRRRLRVLYAQGGYDRPETFADISARNDTDSPVCVSYGVSVKELGYEQPSASPTTEVVKATTDLVSDEDAIFRIEGW